MEESESVQDVPAPMVDGGVEALIGWNKAEKLELLYALKSFGSRNILEIFKRIPTKSPQKIQHALNYYKNKAIKQKEAFKKKKIDRKRIYAKPKIPLASWAKFLTDSIPYKELQTETATAVRMIASLEQIPPAICTENVDFRKIYHLIANAMEGKPVPEDKLSGTAIKKCTLETALVSKAFLRTSTFRYIVNSLNVSEKNITAFPKPTGDPELTTIRHLISQRSYNPLNVPEEHLKPSSSTGR